MKRVEIIVHGQVQGVFYRSEAKKVALRLGLKGFVKNNADGTVKAVAEGPIDELKEFIELCKKGTEMSNVSKLKINFTNAKGEFKDFDVRI